MRRPRCRGSAVDPGAGERYPPAGPMEMVYVSEPISDAGSLTVARQLPLASGKDAAIADVPPTLCLSAGQPTSMVRYVFPDQTTEISIGPVPGKPNLLMHRSGGRGSPASVCGRPAPPRSGRSLSSSPAQPGWPVTLGARGRLRCADGAAVPMVGGALRGDRWPAPTVRSASSSWSSCAASSSAGDLEWALLPALCLPRGSDPGGPPPGRTVPPWAVTRKGCHPPSPRAVPSGPVRRRG